MTNVNAFRPILNNLEGRSLMSATFAALPAEPVGYVVTLTDVLVSSATPDATAVGSSGMSAGKVAYSDLSAVPATPHRERGIVINTAGQSAGFHRIFGDADGDGTAIKKATLFVRKAGADNARESDPYELENVIVSGVRVDTAGGYYQQLLGRSADANDVEFKDNVRTARELGSRPV